MYETSKAVQRRLHDSNFVSRYFRGNGIDIGSGNDALAQYIELFPLMTACQSWDRADGDAEGMSQCEDEKYDFVHSSHCLEDLPNPNIAIKNWFRILKPGGHLIVTVPDEDMYEQGIFPSTFNGDHKWTFTIFKKKSWSEHSANLIDVIASLGEAADVIKIEQITGTYRYGLERMDQTRTPIGEAAIEFVVRKRPGAPTPMAELKQEPASIIPGHMTYIKKKMIALHRPGAIGDIIMTLSLVPLLKKKYPNRLIHYFCNPVIGNSLAGLMQAAGVDQGLDCAGLEQYALKNNYEKVINLIGYPLHEGYPEKPMRKHLIEYFADEMGLDKYTEAVDFVLELSHLTLSKPPRPEGLPARYATIHPYAGWSVYKNWSKEKWEQVIADRPDIPFYQIGSKDDPRINGADHTFMGQILYNSIALMANAELHIGVDSWTNHLTNIEWENPDGHKWFTPAVILWGSTQWTAAGYDRNHNISLNLPCQPCFREDPEISRMPRGPCINPPGQDYDHPRHACMAGISVEAVLEAIEGIWPA